MRTIAIVGSRTGFNRKDVNDEMKKVINDFTNEEGDIICQFISGGAPGVDTYAYEFNKNLPYPRKFEVLRPIDPSIKINYLYRNAEIIGKADMVLVFWNGESKGTKFTWDYAKARNKNIRVFMNG